MSALVPALQFQHTSATVTRSGQRTYWILAAVCCVMGVAVDFVTNASQAFNMLYGVSGVVLVLLVRRGLVDSKWAVATHLPIGMFLVVLSTYKTPTELTYAGDLPLVEQTLSILLLIGVLGAGLLAGWPSALLAFLLVAAANLHPPSRVISLLEFGIVGVLGASMHRILERLTDTNLAMSQVMFLDELTGLKNRSAASDDYGRLLALANRQKQPLMVVLWDVDGLKQINDAQGHAAGDAYLLQFAKALEGSVRQGDVTYRIGGDEFVSLHVNLAEGELLVRRVRARFENVSAGWNVATEASFEEALKEPDARMYADKLKRKQQPRP
jgi:diguanylate cyclase (GGDEF)-like protein